MNIFTRKLLFLLTFSTSIIASAQNEPVVLEAEAATLGSDFSSLSDGGVDYVAPQTDLIAGTYPGGASKVISFTVTFADSGTYKLFIRLRVGPAGANDDSYFYGTGFGAKDTLNADDWVINNNLAVAGQSILDDVVEGQGSAISGVWKWVASSDYTGYETPLTFRVEQGALTQTFQIGARENGLDIDKIAFGRSGIYYTVDNLNKGEAGSLYPPGQEPVGPPLAYGLEKFLGCAFGPDSREDFAGYWNQVTPGNGGKWGWVEGTRDNMVWTDLDEAYQVAMDSDYFYKHHVLVWGNQQPSWIETLDSAEQRAEIEEWFTAVADRYPDANQVEVVNEPLHDPPNQPGSGGGNYIQALGGTGTTGWDWIIEAFSLARDIFPDTVSLMLNEYGIMNSASNTDSYREIIDLLMADTLIDAIGFQAHAFSHDASNDLIRRNIDTLAATGLPIYVTELDVDGETDLKQVRTYMRIFPLFWEHPSIKGITLWGFKPGMWRTDQMAYLIDMEGNERPAMLWLRAYLKGEFVANEFINVSTVSGASTIETEGGTLQMQAEVLPDTSTLTTIYWSVNDNDIATIDQVGLLTAKTNGTVTVSASSLEYSSTVKGTMDITITGQPVEGVYISQASKIIIYPNPADEGWFVIDGTEEVTQVSILDMNGHLIMNLDPMSQPSVEVQLDAQPGIYIVQIIENQKTIYRKLIID